VSKVLGSIVGKAAAIKNAPSKFVATAPEGSRLNPSRTMDKDWQVRVDAGHYNPETKRLGVVLQVNSQATSPELKRFISKDSTENQISSVNYPAVHI
jgi:hypothetical protein